LKYGDGTKKRRNLRWKRYKGVDRDGKMNIIGIEPIG
jgi:hypothetical protein